MELKEVSRMKEGHWGGGSEQKASLSLHSLAVIPYLDSCFLVHLSLSSSKYCWSLDQVSTTVHRADSGAAVLHATALYNNNARQPAQVTANLFGAIQMAAVQRGQQSTWLKELVSRVTNGIECPYLPYRMHITISTE